MIQVFMFYILASASNAMASGYFVPQKKLPILALGWLRYDVGCQHVCGRRSVGWSVDRPRSHE